MPARPRVPATPPHPGPLPEGEGAIFSLSLRERAGVRVLGMRARRWFNDPGTPPTRSFRIVGISPDQEIRPLCMRMTRTSSEFHATKHPTTRDVR